ncbi:MAG: hypothetical protein LBJ02_05835 [Bifidobacteriaceae bacterium]|nr:hypothetical protein [Bifidobacteriaceae bacterium]
MVSRVQVYSRVQLLYDNSRGSGGEWLDEPRAAEVLRSEQNRRLSPREAADWLARYERVFADALARPGYLGPATVPAYRLLERDAAAMSAVALVGSRFTVAELRRLAAARRAALEAAAPTRNPPGRAGRERAGRSTPEGVPAPPPRQPPPGREPPGLAF